MCGINGIIYKNKKPNKLEIHVMNQAIKHRGPDDEGIMSFENSILGHVRLSILDLSPKGKQPMTCDKRFWITYNGEIYNFKTIREELKKYGYKFFSETDTEVILKSFYEWGEECFKKFNGMWSLAILDTQKKEIMISRDRYGVKPCYYFSNLEKFIFSSEIKGILASSTNIQLDPNKLLIGNREIEKFFTTKYHNIDILPPGHILKIDLENFKISKHRWWRSIDNLPRVDLNYEKSKKTINELLYDSTRIRLISDAKISTSLSGGVDSGIIFSILNKYSDDNNLNLDPFIFKDNNNVYENALELCSYYKRKPKIIKDIKYKPDQLSSLFTVLESTSTYFSQIQIYKNQNKNGFKVSIDGHGADECLGGYSRNILNYIFDYQNSIVATYQTLNKIAGNKFVETNIEKYNFVKKVIKYDLNLLKLMYPTSSFNINQNKYIENKKIDLIPNFFLNDLEELKGFEFGQQFMIADANYGGLQWLLNKWDKASMASSVEIRSPFMDWNFFQYALALPTSFKIKNGKNKSILRDSFNDILSPSINNDNRKQGLPSVKNLYNEEYIEYTNKIYSETSFLNSNLWNGKKINKDFQFFKKTKDNESIKNLDVFFRLHLMNKGFNSLKESLNKLTDSNRIKDNYNVLN
jgi:asparagine synthase (glutamine-hydrolysing)